MNKESESDSDSDSMFDGPVANLLLIIRILIEILSRAHAEDGKQSLHNFQIWRFSIGRFPCDGTASVAVKGLNVQMNSKERKLYSDSDSDSLFTKFYNKESVSKAVSIQT